ncbi:hypothetical protein M378DRAFT_85064, partial [Amanita muscaria Koide BX008]
TPKSSLKRGSEALDVADDRPLKRKCLTFIDEDDMDWLKNEVSAIKESIRDLRDDVESKLGRLEELFDEMQQLS